MNDQRSRSSALVAPVRSFSGVIIILSTSAAVFDTSSTAVKCVYTYVYVLSQVPGFPV
jgi:hypothetical protein